MGINQFNPDPDLHFGFLCEHGAWFPYNHIFIVNFKDQSISNISFNIQPGERSRAIMALLFKIR